MTKAKRAIWRGNVRDAALSILLEVQNNQAYSNLLLHQTIERYGISAKDRGLLTELTYGTIQHRMTLDYYLEPFIKGKLDPWVRELLRLSLYQIVYLSKIPPHAAVNEAVEIAKRRGHKGIASTVNGILRSVLRKGVRPLDDIEDPIERIAIETSHPKWLIQRWVEQYGMETTAEMAAVNNKPPTMTARVNTTKATVEEVLAQLEQEGIQAERGKAVPVSIQISSGNLANTEAYQKGLLTIQDESSMLPAMALQVEPGMRVLDMCAAPGGKTTHIAEQMGDQGELLAHDLHPHKLQLIEQNALRLGLTSIQTASGDSRDLLKLYEASSFDRILVDAPCSGFGVVRRKPEIKYGKTEQDIERLAVIQYELLQVAHSLLKAGGILVYSTCTVDQQENAGLVDRFLKEHPDMKLLPLQTVLPIDTESDTVQVLPQDFQSDGFYVAAMSKRK